MLNHLQHPIFQDEGKARSWLESRMWPKGPKCPHCATVGNATALGGAAHRSGVYQCNEPGCRLQFTVTVGTPLERSKLPINKWLMAIFLVSVGGKGMSTHEIHRTLGISYKSTWQMTHRIREAMKANPKGLLVKRIQGKAPLSRLKGFL